MAKRTLRWAEWSAGFSFFLSAVFCMQRRPWERWVSRTYPAKMPSLRRCALRFSESGFYFFPGLPGGMHEKQTPEQQAAYLEKYKQGPTGILIYNLGGEGLQYGKLLLIQFLIGLIAAFIVAWVLAMTAGTTTYLTRVMIALTLGIFAGVFVDLPYWNWYGFPANYVIGHILGGALSWVIAGLGMAAIVKPSTAA